MEYTGVIVEYTPPIRHLTTPPQVPPAREDPSHTVFSSLPPDLEIFSDSALDDERSVERGESPLNMLWEREIASASLK